jgi:hypothetical protein
MTGEVFSTFRVADQHYPGAAALRQKAKQGGRFADRGLYGPHTGRQAHRIGPDGARITAGAAAPAEEVPAGKTDEAQRVAVSPLRPDRPWHWTGGPSAGLG